MGASARECNSATVHRCSSAALLVCRGRVSVSQGSAPNSRPLLTSPRAANHAARRSSRLPVSPSLSLAPLSLSPAGLCLSPPRRRRHLCLSCQRVNATPQVLGLFRSRVAKRAEMHPNLSRTCQDRTAEPVSCAHLSGWQAWAGKKKHSACRKNWNPAPPHAPPMLFAL